MWDGLIGWLPKGLPAADDRGWVFGWRWEMGIMAEGCTPGNGIWAFAYGDLKIQAFRENLGLGLIAGGGVGIPFLGIAWLGLLGVTALGLGDAFGCRTGFWGLGQRDVWRWACGSVRLSVRLESTLRVGHVGLRF